MRVISGTYGSRKLISYDVEGIRPTMDKVKESIFAMINTYIDSSVCLDLFAGTGALGIEAISNNAKKVYFVDKNKNSINIIKSNIEALKITESIEVINDNYTKALSYFNSNNIKFDIIFVDPPYGVIKIEEVLINILNSNIIKDNTIIVCEYEDEKLNNTYKTLNIYKQQKYGNTYICIFKNRK